MNLFAKKIIGIDINDYSVALVELKRRGKKTFLESYNRTTIPNGVVRDGEIIKGEDLQEILKKLINKANPKPAMEKNVAVTFPSSKILTHIFTFPASLSESEIKKALAYEAETIIPFSINDVYWDFSILSVEPKIKKHASQYVLFSAISKKIADQYGEILEAVGLTPSLFGVNPESLRYALAGQIDAGKTSMIIDVGTLSVNYLIVEDDKIKFYFSHNKGGEKLVSDLSQNLQIPEQEILKEKENNKFSSIPQLTEIKKFLEANYKRAAGIIDDYETNNKNSKVENIYIAGEFLNLPDFYDLAKAFFPEQKIEIGDPRAGLTIDDAKFSKGKDPNDKDVFPYSIYFTNAIGVAMRGLDNNGGLNLVPEKLRESFKNKKDLLAMTVAAIAMTAVLLFSATFLFFKYEELNFKISELVVQKANVERTIYGSRYQEIRNQITEFNTEVTALSGIDRSLFSMPQVITDIYQLLPDGVAVSSFNFNYKDLSLKLSGIANSRNQLLKTKTNFEEAEFVKEVIAPISNYDESSQISFLLEVKLNFNKLKTYGSLEHTR